MSLVFVSLLYVPALSWLLDPLRAVLAAVLRLRLEGEGPPPGPPPAPPPLAVTVPAVERNPFMSRRSFCRFFFPPGPATWQRGTQSDQVQNTRVRRKLVVPRSCSFSCVWCIQAMLNFSGYCQKERVIDFGPPPIVDLLESPVH